MSAPVAHGKPRGVLLDIDGTLLDSNDAHARSWIDAFDSVGIAMALEKIRRLIGMGGDKLLPEAAAIGHESELGKTIKAKKKEFFYARYLPDLRPFPHAREFVQRLKRQGLACIVATSSGGEESKDLLAAAHVADLMDDAATSSDAERSKPDPDIVQAAIAKAGIPAANLLFVGDTPYDVQAGRRAGVRVVAFECGGWSAADLKGATAVYADPGALLRAFDDSPFKI